MNFYEILLRDNNWTLKIKNKGHNRTNWIEFYWLTENQWLNIMKARAERIWYQEVSVSIQNGQPAISHLHKHRIFKDLLPTSNCTWLNVQNSRYFLIWDQDRTLHKKGVTVSNTIYPCFLRWVFQTSRRKISHCGTERLNMNTINVMKHKEIKVNKLEQIKRELI